MLNLKILSSEKRERKQILIGKTGVLRMKSDVAKKFNFSKEQKWLVAVNEDEKPYKFLYVIKANQSTNFQGKRMINYAKDTWALECKRLLSELNAKLPKRYDFEPFNENDYDGFRLILSNN